MHSDAAGFFPRLISILAMFAFNWWACWRLYLSNTETIWLTIWMDHQLQELYYSCTLPCLKLICKFHYTVIDSNAGDVGPWDGSWAWNSLNWSCLLRFDSLYHGNLRLYWDKTFMMFLSWFLLLVDQTTQIGCVLALWNHKNYRRCILKKWNFDSQ